MKHGDFVFVNDNHPDFGYVGPARFVKDILPRDKGGKWDGYVHLLEIEPHCAVRIKGEGDACIFPTRCVTAEKHGDRYERI